MRKVLFSLLAIIGLGLVANKVAAQTATKIGIFDIESFIQRTPEFNTSIKPKLQAYQKDSLGAERDQLDTLYTNAQNTYKNDSLAKKSASILAYDRTQLQNIGMKLYGWQDYVQQATQQKYGELIKPIYDKVLPAYKKVVADNKIGFVLNPQVIEDIVDPKSIINLFDLVATQMGVKLLDASQLQSSNQ